MTRLSFIIKHYHKKENKNFFFHDVSRIVFDLRALEERPSLSEVLRSGKNLNPEFNLNFFTIECAVLNQNFLSRQP